MSNLFFQQTLNAQRVKQTVFHYISFDESLNRNLITVYGYKMILKAKDEYINTQEDKIKADLVNSIRQNITDIFNQKTN